MLRRSFLFVPFALAAQTARPRVEIIWAATIPDPIAREALVFSRAYTSGPFSEARRSLETGRFPHAVRAEDQTISDLLGGASDESITIVTSESAEGEDSPLERFIHVPLAIRWPGKLAPGTTDFLVSHVDILPTLLGLSGVSIPDSVQGRDLSKLITRHEGEVPDSIYCEGKLRQKDEWRVVVRGFDKIVFNLKGDVSQFYNLAADPLEENNLIQNRDRDLIKDSMLALGRRWMRKLEDGVDASGLRTR